MANTKYLGRKMRIYVGDTATPVAYTLMANMKTKTFSLATEAIDVTDNDSEDNSRELLEGGVRSRECSFSGALANHAQLKGRLMQAAEDGAIIPFKIVSDMGDQWVGLFQVQSCERVGENGDAEQYSMKLASSGKITYTPAA